MKGFTLIELSIVLVIISLIVGGVIGGKALINSSELQSIITDVNGFKTAINTYKLNYDTLPGDHRDAWSYFGGGVNTICGANADANASDGCNGDGNGRIDGKNEEVRAWQHLALADIYHGVSPVAGLTGTYDLGENLPRSKRGQTGYVMGYSYVYMKRAGNDISYAAPRDNGNTFDTAVLSVKDAISIDKKMDDGLADSGDVYGATGVLYEALCATQGSSNPAPSSYIKGNAGTNCRLVFWFE